MIENQPSRATRFPIAGDTENCKARHAHLQNGSGLSRSRFMVDDKQLSPSGPTSLARFAPKQAEQMSGTVSDVKDAEALAFNTVEYEIVVKADHRKHS